VVELDPVEEEPELEVRERRRRVGPRDALEGAGPGRVVFESLARKLGVAAVEGWIR